jgi:hypothetical protein
VGMLSNESNLGREAGEVTCKVVRQMAYPVMP